MPPCEDYLVTYLSIFGPAKKETLLKAARSHDYGEASAAEAIRFAAKIGKIRHCKWTGLYHLDQHKDIIRTLRNNVLLDKFGPHIVLIMFVFFALVFCLLFSRAYGQDVPDWCIRGIAAVETGAHWNDTGDIELGKKGPDLGPWQMSRAVAREYGASEKRLASDVIYAESLTRKHLARLYGVTGCWLEAVAAYRAGLRGRNKPHALDYAQRAKNYGETYQ